ncbi:MAG TPA: adenosylcobinamide-GDP ribazoletransferase [Jiangellales bacterium]|nr:adenosylcobinamide-GDP ribazoletransferase [Jiangellales bacterium]
MSVLADARTAVGLLTRLPVLPRAEGADRGGLAGAVGYFPFVGLLVAGAGIGVWAVLEPILGPLVAAVASVLATVAVTGGLHEDGLADVADGFWGGSTPDRRLDIMRDSRIGTFGVLAVTGDLLIRVALLAPLDFAGVVRVLVAGHVIGRAAPLVLSAWLPPARPEGLGAGIGKPRRSGVVLACVTVLGAAVAAAGGWAAVPLVAAGVAVAAVSWLARSRIGGYTGDALGAGVLVVNLAVAAAIAALVRAGWV